MPLTFGEAMHELLKKKGFSASSVAEELGFKSRTAFFRILHDECRMPSVQKCFDAAKASPMLNLNQEEIDELNEAMRVSELGKQKYAIHRVIHKMIYPVHESESDQLIEIVGMDGVNTMDDVIALLPDGGTINIMMAGRTSKHLVDRIHRLTQEREIGRITHLFAVDEEDAEDIKVLSCISDILFSSVYSAYYVNETGTGKKNWWMRSGVIMFDHTSDAGEKTTVQLTWLNRRRYFCLMAKNDSGMLFWNSLFSNCLDDLIPLKKEIKPEEEGTAPNLEDYIDFTDAFRKIEQNRAIYSIKPDFPINCVPVEILAPVVTEAYYSDFAGENHQAEEQISRLYEIHDMRSSSIYQRKKPAILVLSPQAMINFAKTGERTDHFFIGRPYTPQERVKILTILRDQTRDNPHFSIYMRKNADIIDNMEVTVYDGYGVAMVKADTSWRLKHDHQEVMLESRMLANHFKSYFLSGVLKDAVMTKEESIAEFDALIKIAENA